MKKFIATLGFIILGTLVLNAQDCNKTYKQYELLMKKENFKGAYPIWKSVLEQCPTYTINTYNHAERILPPLIEASAGTEKKQYIDDLIKAYEGRFKNFPADKNLFKGDLIHYKLAYGRIDSLQAHNEFKKVFKESMDTETKLSFNTLNSFFYNALNLYYYKKISDQEYISVYNNIKNGVKINKEIRQTEKAPLDDKINGRTDSLGNVLVAVTPLNYKEKQILENANINIEYFTEYDSIYEVTFNQYLNLSCETIDKFVNQDFEANKDNKEWLLEYYYLMDDKECQSPAYTKVENRLLKLFPPDEGNTGTVITSRKAVSGNGVKGKKAFKAKRYSEAIKYLKLAINETSNNSAKAGYAVYIGYSYNYLKSYSNAKNWGYKALNYKPGYSAAYSLIGMAYYSGAGAIPGNTFAKRAAGWAAADMARRAGDNKTAAQYDRSAPSSDQCFKEGVNKGSSYKVGGWINVTTTARCK